MSVRLSSKPRAGRLPHLYADGFTYFLTARTHDQKHYLDTDAKKQLFIQIWNTLIKDYTIQTYHWILWSNHYHALIYVPIGDTLPRLINRLHSTMTLKLNRIDNTPGRKIWNQYWDHCVRNEVDFWKHFNYITANPVKHQWCKDLAIGFTYPHSGNPQWVQKQGTDFLYERIWSYPIREFQPEENKSSSRDITG